MNAAKLVYLGQTTSYGKRERQWNPDNGSIEQVDEVIGAKQDGHENVRGNRGRKEGRIGGCRRSIL